MGRIPLGKFFDAVAGNHARGSGFLDAPAQDLALEYVQIHAHRRFRMNGQRLLLAATAGLIAAIGADLIALNPVGSDLETVFLSMVGART